MTHQHRLSKKALSLLLAFVIVLSAFVQLTVTVSAAPDLPEANTEVRGEVCTSLSSAALAYYTGDNSYDVLSELSGYDDAYASDDVAELSALYAALQTLMTKTQTYRPSYSSTKPGTLAYYWQKTDAQHGSENMCCFYTDLRYTNYGTDGYFLPFTSSTQNKSDMQREHIWPKALGTFSETNAGSDLHHLRPSIGSVNNSKGSKPFGEIHDTADIKYAYGTDPETAWWSSDGYFEPKDSVKGDCARILLYVYCRWGEKNLYSAASGYERVIESRDTLLKWCEEDPVDTWEMKRNDLVQEIEGNRNVFIDYPEFAWLMFGLRPPQDMSTPSGEASGAGSSTHTHNWSAWTHDANSDPSTHSRTCSSTEGVCPANGKQTKSCTFDAGTVTNEPTCVATGLRTITCTDCGYSYTQIIPATGVHKDADGNGKCDVCGAEVTGTVTDVLDADATGMSGNTYGSWSGVKSNSEAVYAGQSAAGNNAIQLRTNNNNSGIVTTASGGTVRKIIVEWNENTTAGRTLDIYGKNSAYSAPTDLYNSSKQGTLLGSITIGSSTELTVTGDYAFVGIRSQNNALYLDKIYTVWETGGGSGSGHSHSWSAWAHDENSDPSTHTRYCSNTDGTCPMNGIQTENCDFDAGVVTTAATCIDAGVKTFTCQVCGHSYTEAVPATGVHTDGDGDGKCDVCGAKVATLLEDVLDSASTGVSGSNYADWDGLGGTSSDAVYAGNSAASNSTIQLRSNNSNSGVISTKSGGYVRKIAVKWNTGTADGRTLNIYGKNEAYTSPTQLYGTEKGTLLGTIVYGSSTELTISDDYTFIGFRSASGALYLDEVRITWDTNTCKHTFEWDGNVGSDGKHTEECQLCGETHLVNCTFDNGVYTGATYGTAGFTTYTCTVCGYSYTVEDPDAPATGSVVQYFLTDSLKDGNKVVIYNPKNGKALTSTITGKYYLEGADVTLSGTALQNASDAAVWTVTDNGDGTYTFDQDELGLYGYVSGSYVDLDNEAGDGYVDKWVLNEIDTASHLFSVKCDGLTYTRNSTTYTSVYLEYYSNHFALYGNNNELTGSDDIYLMQFYVLDAEPVVIGESLTATADIDVNVYLDIPAGLVKGNDDLAVRLYDGETLLETIPVATALTDNGYKFTLSKPAKNIRDVVTLKLYDGDKLVQLSKDGTPVDSIDYSVQGYLDSVIANADKYDADLVALCKAMSDYGSYAMIQLKYHADEVVSFYSASEIAAITVDTPNLAGLRSDVILPETSAIEGLAFYGASLVCLDEMTLRLYFTYTGSASLTSGGHPLVAKDGYYYVDITGIAAKDFSVGQIATVTDGTNNYTVSGYSVHTYIRKVLELKSTSTDPEDISWVNVVKAIANYGFKAEAYFN